MNEQFKKLWDVKRINNWGDVMWIVVNSEDEEVLKSKELMEHVSNLAKQHDYTELFKIDEIQIEDQHKSRTFYFRMNVFDKLGLLNNDMHIPDDFPDDDGEVVRPVKLLREQILSERKSLKISIAGVNVDRILYLTTAQRNSPDEPWKKHRIYLSLKDFIEIINSFNLALLDMFDEVNSEVN